MDVEVVHEPERKRFVARVDGREGHLFYIRMGEDVVDFRSTYVDPALRGRRIGDQLVCAAFAWATSEGLKVIPTCWFVDTVVRRHPEYQALVER